ncbi:unnamed protein product [Amoebophrya sp. A25]|nr:unnamed protein product [Amoebophrya sp. A25]|eukprot:GSA25T00023496001.1
MIDLIARVVRGEAEGVFDFACGSLKQPISVFREIAQMRTDIDFYRKQESTLKDFSDTDASNSPKKALKKIRIVYYVRALTAVVALGMIYTAFFSFVLQRFALYNDFAAELYGRKVAEMPPMQYLGWQVLDQCGTWCLDENSKTALIESDLLDIVEEDERKGYHMMDSLLYYDDEDPLADPLQLSSTDLSPSREPLQEIGADSVDVAKHEAQEREEQEKETPVVQASIDDTNTEQNAAPTTSLEDENGAEPGGQL